jgi:hypothetical protein
MQEHSPILSSRGSTELGAPIPYRNFDTFYRTGVGLSVSSLFRTCIISRATQVEFSPALSVRRFELMRDAEDKEIQATLRTTLGTWEYVFDEWHACHSISQMGSKFALVNEGSVSK